MMASYSKACHLNLNIQLERKIIFYLILWPTLVDEIGTFQSSIKFGFCLLKSWNVDLKVETFIP